MEGNWRYRRVPADPRGAGWARRVRPEGDRRFQDARLPGGGPHRQGLRLPPRGRPGDGDPEPGCGRRVPGRGGPPSQGRRSRAGRQPFDAPIKDPRGSVTFRVEAGVLTEFTLTLSGSRRIFDNEVKLDRTTTTKIIDIGSAKVEVPEDAREIVEALVAGVEPKVFVPEPGFRKLFDGRSLAGWEGRPGFWSVEDRAIVGRTTKENPTRGNTFLFAKSGGKDLIVDDFELRLSYRITADNDKRLRQLGRPVPQSRPGRLRRGRLPGGHGGRPAVLGHPLRRGRRCRRAGDHGRSRREGHLDLATAARR